MWNTMMFGSGTHIVKRDVADEPWLYVYGPRDEDDSQPVRYSMCKELERFLNGGQRPLWLCDMARVSEEELIGADGSSISATGPLYDADPPNLRWETCEDVESKNKRARLIDLVSNDAWKTRGEQK